MILIRFITLVGRNCCRKQNTRRFITQQVELQTIKSTETTQTTTKTDQSLPNTTLNTLPQTQNEHPRNVTQSDLKPPYYNEYRNKIRPHRVPPLYQNRHPHPSAAVTSFAALTSNNTVVQTSRQQSSNVGNCEDRSDVINCIDNPIYGLADTSVDYNNVETSDKVVKALKVPPPPSYAELFNN